MPANMLESPAIPIISYQNSKAKETYDFISLTNRTAYKDIFLLSNQVLSKNPFTNNFLLRYLRNEKPRYPPLTRRLHKLLQYYAYSLKDFVSYVIEFVIFRISGLRFTSQAKELVIIDTFFMIRKIKDEGYYKDYYFPGLKILLDKLNKDCVYLPVLEGVRKCYKFEQILKILKQSGTPFLCEYQLLSVVDLLRLLYFIITYPFHIFEFIKTLTNKGDATRLLKFELIDTLEQVTFRGFSRYLQGRRISGFRQAKIKVISWYENQAIDKNLYRGLRSVSTAKVQIYGAQLFFYSADYLNIIPDLNEGIFLTLPDIILVNGPGLIPTNTGLNYAIGPSLRYSKIFQAILKRKERNNILVLLSYFKEVNENILRVLSGIEYSGGEIYIKVHPAIEADDFRIPLPVNAIITDDDNYKLFKTTKIVIGAASGSLIESASLGIPVISVKQRGRLDCNPLPYYGKGVIWNEISTQEELKYQIEYFERALDNDCSRIDYIAATYKRLFFCEPTEEKIIESFDLYNLRNEIAPKIKD